MNPFCKCLVVFALVSSAWAQAQDSDKALLADIERLSILLTDGYAEYYPDATRIHYGSLSESAPRVAVVLFTVEGFSKSNGHNEYLALFREVESLGKEAPPREKPFRLVDVVKVGSKGTRSFDYESATIGRGTIVLGGSAFVAGDALCCPSTPVRATFQVLRDRIVEAVESGG